MALASFIILAIIALFWYTDRRRLQLRQLKVLRDMHRLFIAYTANTGVDISDIQRRYGKNEHQEWIIDGLNLVREWYRS